MISQSSVTVPVSFDSAPYLAALVASLAALIVGIPALRLRGLYLSMATLGWNAILVVLFNRLIAAGQLP